MRKEIKKVLVAGMISITILSLGETINSYASGPSGSQTSTKTLFDYGQGIDGSGFWVQNADKTWNYKMKIHNYMTDKVEEDIIGDSWIRSETEEDLWYYVDSNGKMVINDDSIDGCHLNEKGEWRGYKYTSDGKKVKAGGIGAAFTGKEKVVYQYNADQLVAIERYKKSIADNTRVKVRTEFYYPDELNNNGGWEQNLDGTWSYRKKNGSFIKDAWIQSTTDKSAFYYIDSNGKLLINGCTPYGFVTDSYGIWSGKSGAVVEVSNDTDMAERMLNDPAFDQDVREHQNND